MSDAMIDFKGFCHVNNLWPQLVEKLGLERSQYAVNQAFDLQKMSGESATIPLLFAETCGVALCNIQCIRLQTGLALDSKTMVLLISLKSKEMQLIQTL